MSTAIPTIQASAKTLIAAEITTAGDSPQELQFVYDVAKNPTRILEHGYGIKPLGANPADAQLIGAISYEQDFEIILTDTFARGADDSQREDVVEALFGLGEEIAKSFINTRISNPTIVSKTSDPVVSEPEFGDTEAKKYVIYRMTVTVTYRINL